MGIALLGTSNRSSRSRIRSAVQLVVDTSDVTFASIYLADGSEDYLGVADGASPGVVDVPGGFLSTVLASGEVLLVEDAPADERFSSLSTVVAGPRVRSYIGAPIRTSTGAVIGVYGMYRDHPITIGPEVAPMIQGLALWAGAEFENATEEDAAVRVQRSLRPSVMPTIPGYDLAGSCTPTLLIGGDFYDWYPVAGGIAISLGDVMGKGLGAGMLAASIRAVLRASTDLDDPTESVQLVERVLAADFESAESFATLFHAHLRVADGRLRFADAGHGLTVIVRHTGEIVRLESENLPMGVLPEQRWTSQDVTLAAGDTIVTVSDGLLDLYDGSLESMTAVAHDALHSGSARDIVDGITALAVAARAPDDVTAVALRRLAR